MRSPRQRFLWLLALSLIMVWISACMPRLQANLPIHSALANTTIEFPADAGLLNVQQAPYNAKGDGKTDDTVAIQQALDDNVNQKRPLYFPNGTYLNQQHAGMERLRQTADDAGAKRSRDGH